MLTITTTKRPHKFGGFPTVFKKNGPPKKLARQDTKTSMLTFHGNSEPPKVQSLGLNLEFQHPVWFGLV